jgi:hypothetical protein
MPAIDLSILNQRQTPAFYADVFANRPAAGFVGRIFVSTNTFAFYRDNGTGWDLIGGPGTGTITGSGTAGTVPLWNGASTIGDSTLIEGSTKFTTTKDIQADAVYLNGMTAGNGILYYSGSTLVLANYNASGQVKIEANGGQAAQIIASDLSTTFYGNIIRNGGTSSQFLKADGSLDSNTYNTGSGAASQVAFFSGTNAITGENNLWWDSANNHLGINTNTPATALDVNHNGTLVAKFNNTTSANTLVAFENAGNEQWWIGTENINNDFLFYDATNFPTLSLRTTFKTNGQVLIGGGSTGSGRLVVESAASDNGIQIVGANAPSLRIDSAATGPTKRIGLGISTATNNFIQGSADRDMCIFNGSTTASPMLFGIYGTTNVQEAARISAARNFLIGTTTDAGQKLQVSGNGLFTSGLTSSTTFQLQAHYFYNGSGSNDIFASTTGNAAGSGNFAIVNTVGGANTAILGSNTGYFRVGTSGQTAFSADRFVVELSSGNIGVGVSNPQYKLDVSGIVGSSTGFLISSGQYNNITEVPYTGIFMTASSSPDGFGSLLISSRVDAARPIIFGTSSGTNSAERMRIAASTGNLLIGTTTDAGSKLQVNGTAKIGDGSTIANALLSLSYSDNSSAIGFESGGAGGDTGYIGVQKGVGNGLIIGCENRSIIFKTGTAGVFAGTTRFTIKNSGVLNIASIPTSSAGLSSGDIYSNAGILTIVP